MRFYCWLVKATDTLSEFAFHDIIDFAKGPQCYVYTHFTYLVIYEAYIQMYFQLTAQHTNMWNTCLGH